MSFRHRKPYKIQYSQNFLHDHAAQVLSDKMNLKSDDVVIEIGPGTGQLTKLLLQRVKFVLAIEKDPQLSSKLCKDFQNYHNFMCVNADFLNWELPLTTFKLVGNIPFAHTSEIVRKLVNHQSPPKESYLIIQYEATQKFTGVPTETLFSLTHKPVFEFKLLTKIPRHEFNPQPRIDAGLLQISRRDVSLLSKSEMPRYIKFIEQVFQNYHPNAYSALKKFVNREKLHDLSNKLSVNLSKKRSDIKFEEWLKIFLSV